VDEVLAVGDAAFQKKCLGKIGEVSKEGRTVLFVSHNMSAIQQLCKRSLLIEAGRLAMDQPTDRVVAHYLSDAFTEGNGDFDLSRHPSRPKGSPSIIQRLILSGLDGVAKTKFYPDDCLIADLILDPPENIKEPRVALAIEDNQGRRILTAASYFQTEPLDDLRSRSRVRCILPRLDLGAGQYLVSVSIFSRSSDLNDNIVNAAWFEVVWSNNYSNGESYYPIYGPVLRGSTWKTNPDISRDC
jgi:lipopolysaccharide transport system ATP-binding protein